MSANSMIKELKSFKNFEEAANDILQIMSKFIDINTLFIARNDQRINEIVNVFNKDEVLLEQGDTLPFGETFCKLSVDHGRESLFIPDLHKNELTAALNVTKNLGGGCFIGIPIYYGNGENYGTICGLDKKPIELSQEHIEMFETMASLLTYVLDLDYANKQIQNLSAPFVPITNGVAILPVIGLMNEERVEHIIYSALTKSKELSLQYLIIDLSGIIQIDAIVTSSLLRIASILKLVGVTPILTGIRPDLALKAIEFNNNLQGITIEASLERALNRIGFSVEKSELNNNHTAI